MHICQKGPLKIIPKFGQTLPSRVPRIGFFDIDPRSRLDLGSISVRSRSPSPPSGRPPLPPPSPPSANARPALPRPSDVPPPSPEPPRHACAPRRRPERPSGPLRPASAPSAAATRVHRSRAAVMTGTPHGPTAPTRVATAVRSRVAPTARPRFDPLRLTAPHNLLCSSESQVTLPTRTSRLR